MTVRQVFQMICRCSPLMVAFVSCASFPDGSAGQDSTSGFTDVTVGDRAFRVADGYSLEMAADAELVPRPIVADIDHQGRLFVADSSGSNESVEDQLRDKPHRIMCLYDRDQDGRYEESSVFADRMMFPAGVLCHAGSVFVSAPPVIWRLTDTDDDGVADERSVWFDAKTLTSCANDLHGPYLGPDGWIYWCKGAFAEQTHELTLGRSMTSRAAHVLRRHLDGGPVELVMSGGMDNPVEVAFSAEGERFFTTTFLQHPSGGRRDGLIHAIYGGLYGKSHGVLDGHVRTGPDLMPVMTHLGPAAPSGLTRLRSADGCGTSGDLVSTAFNLHQVLLHQLRPAGATYQTTEVSLIESPDLDFHPTDCLEDADGSLLIVDTGGWYKLCCPTSQLHKPDVLGGIYRLRRTASRPPEDAYGHQLDWQVTPTTLANRLGDTRPCVRQRAMDRLAQGGTPMVDTLVNLRTTSDNAQARRNAVWTLCRIEGQLARHAISDALSDASESVRHAALHAVALHRDQDAVRAVIKQLTDASPAIRRAAAEALGRIGDPQAIAALATQSSVADGRVLRHAFSYAMLEVGDVDALLQAWQSRPAASVLVAIDQLEPGRLDAETVTPHLVSQNEALAAASAWICSRHPEWHVSVTSQLARRLERHPTLTPSLRRCIVSLAEQPGVQNALAQRLPDHATLVLSILREAGCSMLAESLQQAVSDYVASNVNRPERLTDVLAALVATQKPIAASSQLHDRVVQLVDANDLPMSSRLMAVECLQKSGVAVPASVFDWLLDTATTSDDSLERRTAAAALAAIKLPRSQLLGVIQRFGDVGPLELPELLETLRSTDDVDVASAAIDQLSETPSLAVVPSAMIRDVFVHFGPATLERINKLLSSSGSTVGADASRLEQMLERLPVGDVRRGQAVFHSAKAACFTCHPMGYRGGDVGPDLTRIGKIRSKRDLLEAIMFPSASFVRSFEPVVVTTDDGQVISGVLRDETETELVLFDGQAKPRRIPLDSIEARTRGDVSIMPSGLDQLLSEQQLADVIAFLQASK